MQQPVKVGWELMGRLPRAVENGQLPDCRDQLRVESDHNQKILYNSMDPVCLSFDIG